jgi:hypothetical protein
VGRSLLRDANEMASLIILKGLLPKKWGFDASKNVFNLYLVLAFGQGGRMRL